MKNVVEILNTDLEKVAELRALAPLNQDGMVLKFIKRLSGYGECRFRVSTKDPIFDTLGDILEPHKYHVRIKRANTTIWQGAIVDNPSRTKQYQEVRALEYLFYLGRVLVERDTRTEASSEKHYRKFDSGTMKAAVKDMMDYAKTYFGSNHILGSMTISNSNIDNPNFPNNYKKTNGQPLTGAWTFSSNLTLQFDYNSILFVLNSFALYAGCDYEIDNDLVFHFKTRLGTNKTNIGFVYGARGNIIDYDIPRYGQRMANDLYGISATYDGEVLRSNKIDSESQLTYGKLQDAMPFADVKDNNTLTTRVTEELRYVKSPDNAPLSFVLNEKGYFLGAYDVGDIVTVKVDDGPISYDQPRRIVQFVVSVHNTGREITTVETNKPKDEDL